MALLSVDLPVEPHVACTPAWLDKKLTLQAGVIYVPDRQVAGSYDYRCETASRNTPNPLCGHGLNCSDPRYVRITARYDF